MWGKLLVAVLFIAPLVATGESVVWRTDDAVAALDWDERMDGPVDREARPGPGPAFASPFMAAAVLLLPVVMGLALVASPRRRPR